MPVELVRKTTTPRPRRAQRSTIAAAFGAALLLLAGCGGGDGSPAREAAAARPDRQALATSPTTVSAPQRWSDPATWGGSLPAAGASVVIPAGKQVLLDGATPALGSLIIEGALLADPARDVAITAQAVFVRGGRLSIGSAGAPYLRQAAITLTGTSAADLPGLAGMGAKVLAQLGGTIELHGRPLAASWTRLDGGDVAAGARRIRLATAPGWRVGDRIVIATSSKNQDHHDVAQIAAIDGAVVDLVQGLRYPHFGATRTIGSRSLDVRAAVGLLSRNIVVQGDAGSQALQLGGHAMFMAGSAGATVRIAGVEFAAMGQLNQTGRYPLHFHEMGSGCLGCYVRDSSVRDSIQRGIVLHDVSGVRVERNVVFNTVGHNIFVETAATRGNVIDGNLALVNRQPSPMHTNEVLLSQSDRLPSNFWFKSGANTVTNNVAAGSFSNGFNYDFIGGEPIDFRANTASAAMGLAGAHEGDFDIFGGLLISSEEPRPAGERIEDVLVFHNAVGLWPEENGVTKIERFAAVGNGINLLGRGVGNRLHFKDGLVAARLPGSSGEEGAALQYVYGSETRLENVAFAGYGTLGLSASDTMPTQSLLTMTGISFVGARPTLVMTDLMIFNLPDDSLLPRGWYVHKAARWLADAACTTVVTYAAEPEESAFWRCPRPYAIAELDIRSGTSGAYSSKVNPYLVRNDGLRYRRAGGDAGLGSGMHGTSVLFDSGKSYRIDQLPSSNGWAVRLTADALPNVWDAVMSQTARVDIAIPVPALPRGVWRTGTRSERPNAPGAATPPMRPATSAADYEANPLTTYLHDAANRRIWVKASGRWVVVTP